MILCLTLGEDFKVACVAATRERMLKRELEAAYVTNTVHKTTCLLFQEWSPGISTMAPEVISPWLTHTLTHTPTFGLCLQQLSRLGFHVLNFIEGLTVNKLLFSRTRSFNNMEIRKTLRLITGMIVHCFKNRVEQQPELGGWCTEQVSLRLRQLIRK